MYYKTFFKNYCTYKYYLGYFSWSDIYTNISTIHITYNKYTFLFPSFLYVFLQFSMSSWRILNVKGHNNYLIVNNKNISLLKQRFFITLNDTSFSLPYLRYVNRDLPVYGLFDRPYNLRGFTSDMPCSTTGDYSSPTLETFV